MANEVITGVYVEMAGHPGVSYASRPTETGWDCPCGLSFGFAPIKGDLCKCGAEVRFVRRGAPEPAMRSAFEGAT
jgi:hypothetical protein